MTTPGRPAVVTPATRTPGALRWTRYQIDGALGARCGSFASKGFPEAVCLPLTTQLLLAARASAYRPRRESERDSNSWSSASAFSSAIEAPCELAVVRL